MTDETFVTTAHFFVRVGSRQGSKHVRLNLNNQDAHVFQSFEVPSYGKKYHVGLVSDGCSGQPAFSHSEVGAHLMALYAYRRIQELICAGVAIEQIPTVLYPSITEFILDIMTKVMPPNIVWKYPIKLEDRENWTGQNRFRVDYLSATLLGFITDGEYLVTFSAGDGLLLVNDDLVVIDQNNQPDYPSISLNKPGVGFISRIYMVSEINRVAIATDGLEKLLQDVEFRNKIFATNPGKVLGLQTLLNVTSTQNPELMSDDCTVVTLEKKGI
jgi:Protein phosphatase 2C